MAFCAILKKIGAQLTYFIPHPASSDPAFYWWIIACREVVQKATEFLFGRVEHNTVRRRGRARGVGHDARPN